MVLIPHDWSTRGVCLIKPNLLFFGGVFLLTKLAPGLSDTTLLCVTNEAIQAPTEKSRLEQAEK